MPPPPVRWKEHAEQRVLVTWKKTHRLGCEGSARETPTSERWRQILLPLWLPSSLQHLYQRPENFSAVNRQIVKYITRVIWSLWQLLRSAVIAQKQPYSIHKWVWLCSIKLYLWRLKCEFHAIFTYHDILFFYSYFSTFKNLKTFLSLQALQKSWEAKFGLWAIIWWPPPWSHWPEQEFWDHLEIVGASGKLCKSSTSMNSTMNQKY